MHRIFAAVFLVILLVRPSAACAPTDMVMIVYRDATPGLDSASFASKPKTLVRYGTDLARIEEEPDPTNGIHALTIVSMPDVWMINRYDGTIRHVKDQDPDGVFVAPVFGRVEPQFLKEYQFGCELDFMLSHGVEPEPVHLDIGDLELYNYRNGDHTVILMVDQDRQVPVISILYLGTEIKAYIEYLRYSLLPELDMKLFEAPGRESASDKE